MVSNYLNKIFYLVVLFFIVLVINILTTSNSNAACAKLASGAIIVDPGDSTPFADTSASSTFDQDACQEVPDEYKLTFYKVALCAEAEDPYTNATSPDYSGCVNILNEEKTVTIKPNEDTDLLSGGLEIPLGSYSIIAVIVDNHIQVKTKQQYALANGNDATIIGSSGGSGGTWCWSKSAVTLYSNDGDLDTDTDYEAAQAGVDVIESGTDTLARLDCGAEPSDSDVEFATEIIDNLNDPTHHPVSGAYQFSASLDYEANNDLTGLSGSLMGANLIQSDNATIAANEDQARRIAGFFKYPNHPIEITEETTSFKLQLSTSGSVSIDVAVDGMSGNIFGAKMGADPFTIKVVTSEVR